MVDPPGPETGADKNPDQKGVSSTSTTTIQIDEMIDSMTQKPHLPEDQKDADPIAEYKRKALATLRDDQDELKQTLVENFGVPAKSAADLVLSMADMCREFSQFIVKVGSYQEKGTILDLNILLHNFFHHRGWGLHDGYRVPSGFLGPWSTRFLNEFMLNTVPHEIPFVYLLGEKVEVLSIPDSVFWMDFKASLQATGDWDCLQTHSDRNLGARSMLAHAAKSALGCLLGRLNVSHPPDALNVLFKYIDTPRLLEIFTWPLDYLKDDATEFCKTYPGDDYDWDDFLEQLGREAGPESVNLRSKHQVEEFMSVYKYFRGTFVGYEIDQHGILRHQEFKGWPAYVRFRNRYPNPAGKGGCSIH
jgi:hypothetical protein